MKKILILTIYFLISCFAYVAAVGVLAAVDKRFVDVLGVVIYSEITIWTPFLLLNLVFLLIAKYLKINGIILVFSITLYSALLLAAVFLVSVY